MKDHTFYLDPKPFKSSLKQHSSHDFILFLFKFFLVSHDIDTFEEFRPGFW